MRKIISIVLSFGLLFQQSGLVYAVGELNLANYLSQAKGSIFQPDIFQPPRLRYISYDIKSNDFKLLLDKGGAKRNELSNSLNSSTPKLNDATQELFNYFLIGLALPNDTFWVNLRPDAADSIIDPLLEKTDIGKIFLESDLQLKKDTASFTSPQTTEGKIYWDKLYKKAGELFGTENITIPTITRPWIVPNEVIVRETEDSAYIYKATLKVMLEADYLIGRGTSRTAPTPDQYAFSDPRLKELNEYSSQIIRETIIPKLTKEINSSKRYAQLRQVYYSLVLSRWFKERYRSQKTENRVQRTEESDSYVSLIDSGKLTWGSLNNDSSLITSHLSLLSQQPCDKQAYFQAYQQSFKGGEYNLKETVATPFGQSIRSYLSGGIVVDPINEGGFIAVNMNKKQVTAAIVGSPLALEEEVKKLDGALGGFIESLKPIPASSDFVNAVMEYRDELKGVTSITDFNVLLERLITKYEEMHSSHLNRILGDAGGYSGEIMFKLKEFKEILQEQKNNQLKLVDKAETKSLSVITLKSGVNVRLNGWGSETLREVLKDGQPVDIVVCPPQLYRNGVEYGSPEFLVYYNLFRAPAAPDAPINLGWRRGNYTFLVAQNKEQKEAIERIVSRSFLGSPREFYEKIHKREINIEGISSDDISSADIEHFMRNRAKFPTIGDSLEIGQFAKVYVLGEEFDYKTRSGRDLKLKIERDDNGRYRITETVDGQAQIYQNIAADEYRQPVTRSIAVSREQIYEHNFLNRPEFGYTILGDSHGFDPNGNNTSILVSVAGKYLLIDGSPATYQTTKNLKIPSLDIEYVFLTHTHDDHDAILNRVLNGFPVKLIATPAVYANFVAKANDKLRLYDHDINIGEWVDYIKILPGQKLPIFNGKAVIECPSFYNKHTLPTSAVKIGYVGEGGDIESSISYTADTQLDPQVWEFVKGSDVIFHDAGVLPLHPSPEGVAKQITDEELRRRVILVHASNEDIEKAGNIGLAKGDMLESISLIPADLSARLKDNDNISKCLAAVAYLSSLSLEALRAFAEKTKVRNFLPGNKIIKQGETIQSLQPSADVLYLIVSGEAKVNIRGEEIRLKPGMTFGEFSAVNPLQPRSVDVVAGDNGLVAISFSKAAITALIKDFPEVRESVERIQHNLLYLERLSEIEKSPFNQLPIEVLYDLAEKLKVVEFEKGEDILIEGEYSDSGGAYIITEGHVEVTSKSGGKLREIYDSSPDNVVGEGVFFNPEGKRNATVTTMTKVKALHIAFSDFQKALEHHPSLKYKFYVLSANRRDENTNGHHREMAVGSPLSAEEFIRAVKVIESAAGRDKQISYEDAFHKIIALVPLIKEGERIPSEWITDTLFYIIHNGAIRDIYDKSFLEMAIGRRKYTRDSFLNMVVRQLQKSKSYQEERIKDDMMSAISGLAVMLGKDLSKYEKEIEYIGNGNDYYDYLKKLNKIGSEVINTIENPLGRKEFDASLVSVKERLSIIIKYNSFLSATDKAMGIIAAGSPLTGVSSAIGSEIIVSGVKRGGIDLTDRMLNMHIERVGSFALSSLILPEIADAEALDLDKEYERIQAMASSNIRPSDARILEFAAACYYRGEFDQRLAQVSSCIKAAHISDELLGKDSSPTLRLATILPDALYGG